MVGAASNNKPMRGRLREGCRLHVRRAKPSPYKIEGEGGRFGSTKRKNIIVRCGLHNVVQPGGQNKKISQR
jgi:hypothetical protein